MALPASLIEKLTTAETALATAQAKESEHGVAAEGLSAAIEAEELAEVEATDARSHSDDAAEAFIAEFREYFGITQ